METKKSNPMKEKNIEKILILIALIMLFALFLPVLCWGQVYSLDRVDSMVIGGGVYTVDPDVVYYDATDTIAELQSEQGDPVDNVSITFQVNTGGEVYIDYGDGEGAQQITADGNDQVLTSNYSTVSTTYDIQIFGDLDSITKFEVLEKYVTLGNFADNIKLMTGLDYLSLRYCEGDAYAEEGDIPQGMTNSLYLMDMSEMTATFTDDAIPDGLTVHLYLYNLPKMTATFTDDAIPDGLTGHLYLRDLPEMTATFTDDAIPDGLTDILYLYNLPKMTATFTDDAIPDGLTVHLYLYNLPKMTATFTDDAIPDGLTGHLYLRDLPEMTATFTDDAIPDGLTDILYLRDNAKLTATFDMTDIPDLSTLLNISYNHNVNISYTTGTLPAWSTLDITLNDCNLTTTELDAFLNQYAIDAGTGEATLDFSGATRSEDSDDAVITLKGKQKTIITTAGTEAP